MSAGAAPAAATSSPALTNWQSALISFKKAGASVAENKFAEAKVELVTASTNLATPYNVMAAQFVTNLDSISTNKADAKNPAQRKAITELCADLRAYDAALQLQSAGSSADDLADDPTYAWRLLEVGKTDAAVAEYRRKLRDEAVETFAIYFKEQIRLAEQRAANLTNAQFSLELVRNHYLKDLEQKADSL